MKILSCIPEQRLTYESKMEWLEDTIKKYRPDIFITPQEFFGGIQQIWFDTGEPISYKPTALLPGIQDLCDKYDCGIFFGAVIDCPGMGRKERVYAVEPGNVCGFFDKMMLPAYDHISAKGMTGIIPENDFKNRSRIVEIMGIKASVLFCWEVYSNFIWHSIAVAEPDLLVNMIKFGVCGYPIKAKENGMSVVTGFGYGGDGGWIERLKMGAMYDLYCPIVTSTNSWKQPKRCRPLCGTIYPFGEDTLFCYPKGSRGEIEEHIIVDEFDPIKWRYYKTNKFKYKEVFDEWLPSQVRTSTMMMKIRRMERKMLKEIKDDQLPLF
tara:strand:- start:228 stop:1196 length:969 start_codon:yes stop_codon:yes gene_type:complete